MHGNFCIIIFVVFGGRENECLILMNIDGFIATGVLPCPSWIISPLF